MKKQIIVFMGLLCSFFTYAQQAELDQLLTSFESEQKAMGTVSIFQNGMEVYNKSFGKANLALDKIANENTKYKIGSISKVFTASVILKLVEEKKLKLSTSLSMYFSKVPNANKITIKHLLSHQSGLYNITDEEGFHTWIRKPRNRKEMLGKIIKGGTVFEAGTQTAYSNSNYILLSFIIENIENKPFARVLQDRIFEPLNLKRTTFGKKLKPKKNQAYSYFLKENSWTPIYQETDLKSIKGAGGIASTAKEVNTFFNALFTGKIISNELIEIMTTPVNEWGLGISVLDFQGMTIYGHDGGIDGYQSLAVYLPGLKTSIAFTFNAATIPATQTAIQILQTYLSAGAKK
ncbi:Class A beta-lactamase-related serine hydrolase [Tenacibaculum sp. 190130A14a]|uniref:D-alanyl-D-alanine carboxypeptidase n=1 Tax=Tenacibaculum polynesiense TaxID=3137857 RepID=A0ABP1EYB1_9FLAO